MDQVHSTTELRMKFSKQSLTGFIERRSRRRHPNLFGLPYGYSVINVQLVIAIKQKNNVEYENLYGRKFSIRISPFWPMYTLIAGSFML